MSNKSNAELKKLNKLCLQESSYYLNNIDLIAASNFLRPDIAVLTEYKIQRSMEGILGKRPYAGTKYLDQIESIAVETVKRIFKAEHANVQLHSGSQANQAAYAAFLQPGDKIISMRFDNGGHITHGNPVNFSGKIYKFYYYSINSRTQNLDYPEILKISRKIKPKMIVAGASSYPRKIDYTKFGRIAKKTDAFFMADISHPAGLIAAGFLPSPFPHADVVTTTTEKTLWGPHAAVIMCKERYAKDIDRAVHPGTQSSIPISRIVQICKALLFVETKKFKNYTKKVLNNSKVLEKKFSEINNAVLFGGTDSHFVVINVRDAFGLSGQEAEKVLEKVGIFTNRQVIPWEKKTFMKRLDLE